ncbi:probable ethanolamine kinase isoform X1 [Lycium barbarum]|uniref:probable ethanolamine kinase isoform X1 n=1 Tax=Lycium barbarum TaxID=112863 RepID=UPI00293E3098|nr:probable ethanolamine kinase isoform X1 [Lycium barbarum]
MGAVKKIWNAMEVADGAPNTKFASSPLTVDHTLSIPHMKPQIVELCKDLFNRWSCLDDSHFSVETVSGGITNLLLKVSVREDDGKNESMTVRLYGPNTECVINRERELQAIQYLSAAGFGAKLLGVFGNGIVQSFIDARTLTPSDLRNPKLAAEIAKQLRKFHQVEIPGSKEPQVWNDVLKFFTKGASFTEHSPVILYYREIIHPRLDNMYGPSSLTDWKACTELTATTKDPLMRECFSIFIASTLQFDDGEKKIKYETILFQEVHNEIIELKELTDRLNAPVVFAHNDLLSGNLMLNEDKGKLYFIDFEYGSYNYRGFDIGNHFNEYAGYDCDYTLYPSKDEQFHFFRHYLDSDRPNEISDKDLDALYVETSSYMLASHLYWALWALIQAKMSPIDFDYISYFFRRYNEYKKQKEKCFALAKSYLSKPELGERST